MTRPNFLALDITIWNGKGLDPTTPSTNMHDGAMRLVTKLVQTVAAAAALLTLTHCQRPNRSEGPYAHFTFVPSSPTPYPATYPASEIGQPGVPHLSAAELADVKRSIKTVASSQDQYIRFAMPESTEEVNRAFTVFTTRGLPIDGESGGGSYTDFPVLNTSSCNLEYDPRTGEVQAATQCVPRT